MSERNFYRTVIEIEILSQDPIPEKVSLEELASECEEFGAWSGKIQRCTLETVDGKKMANLLSSQDENPAFFGLTKTGEDM